jgi:prephenate dehydrogenase
VNVLGLDADPSVVEAAQERELVDNASTDPSELLPGADLIILAAPVNAIIGWLRELPRHVTGSCIVLDIGSTKREIAAAMEELPRNFEPIGGHPICGSERLTLQNAAAGLYKDAPFLLTLLKRTTPHTLGKTDRCNRGVKRSN